MILDKNKIYYVYTYLDPRKKVKKYFNGIYFEYEPFYIGKGKYDRIYSHILEYERVYHDKTGLDKCNLHRKFHKIHNIINSNKKPIIVKLVENIDEEEAFVTEEIMIECFGTVDNNGCLFNYRLGGDSGGSLSVESRKKISRSLEIYYKENNMWDYENNKYIPRNKGVPMTEKGKESLRIKNLGKIVPRNIVDKIAESNRINWSIRKDERWGKMKNTMISRGYVRDNKTIGRKISEIKKGNVVISEKQKREISETLKRKYSEGIISPHNKGKSGVFKNKGRWVSVYQFDDNLNLIKKWDSIGEAGEIIGNPNSIRNSIKNNKLYKGFHWSYSPNINQLIFQE